jgi:anti-sigma-K factor RskA
MTSGIHDCGGDASAFALGALDPAEEREFIRHLEHCAVCRDEVQALRGVVDALPMAAPQVPPTRALRRRVLAEVHADERAARRRRRQGWAPGRRLIPVAAAAALAVAAFVAVDLGAGHGPGAVRVFAATSGDAQVRVTDGHAELIVHHLAQTPAGTIYEVWVQRAGTTRPAPTTALFGVTGRGDGDVDVPGSLGGVRAVMVTLEPAGGSAVPTSRPVIVAPIS